MTTNPSPAGISQHHQADMVIVKVTLPSGRKLDITVQLPSEFWGRTASTVQWPSLGEVDTADAAYFALAIAEATAIAAGE